MSHEKRGDRPKEEHTHIRSRNVLKDIAVEISDGLITNLALLAGFASANSEIGLIRLAGVAALLAGGVSIFFSGVLETRADRDLFEADSKRESKEIETEPDEEKVELRSFYLEKGLSVPEADMVVKRVTSNKKIWLEDILLHELRIHKSTLENSFEFGIILAVSFLGGAFVPLAPYLFLSNRMTALSISAIVSFTFLFSAGVWRGIITAKTPWKKGVEMVFIGAAAFMILFLIGRLLAVV